MVRQRSVRQRPRTMLLCIEIGNTNTVMGMYHQEEVISGFALATGAKRANVAVVGALAAEVMAEAILRGVRQAESAGGIPAARDMATAGIED